MNSGEEVRSSAPLEPAPIVPGWTLSRVQRLAVCVFFFSAATYVIAAYLIAPWVWTRYVRHHPSLANIPDITHTHSGIPGDPLNVALIATQKEIKQIMIVAGWYPADPLTLKSCLEIAEASVLKRPYDDAPVSSLYLFGRKEDLAFEKPVGHDPRERHHVRFWQTDREDIDGSPVWIGSATFDMRVGLSKTTGEITHHISPDVDKERDFLMTDLNRTGDLVEQYDLSDFHATTSGKNGGGDPWHTDGSLAVGVVEMQ